MSDAPRAVTMDKMSRCASGGASSSPAARSMAASPTPGDYGPMGVELKRNVKEAWWRDVVRRREDVVGLDAAIMMNPAVWEASGHLAGFTDPLVECPECRHRFRADHVESSECPDCGGALGDARQFNLMLKTFLGAVEDTASTVYMRPGKAQGMFVNFLNVQTSTRKKLPFGIAQIGKSFRNEITPGNFIFRTREFEQMEMGVLCESRRGRGLARLLDQGTARLVRAAWRPRREPAAAPPRRDELSTTPRRPRTSSTSSRGAGLSSRASPTGPISTCDSTRPPGGARLTYFDNDTNQHVTPYVIEPASGVDRAALAFMVDAYDEEEVGGEAAGAGAARPAWCCDSTPASRPCRPRCFL